MSFDTPLIAWPSAAVMAARVANFFKVGGRYDFDSCSQRQLRSLEAPVSFVAAFIAIIYLLRVEAGKKLRTGPFSCQLVRLISIEITRNSAADRGRERRDS